MPKRRQLQPNVRSAINDFSATFGTTKEQSGEWILEHLIEEANISGAPLSDADVEFLRTPVFEMSKFTQAVAIDVNNRVVPLARQPMDRSKRAGTATTKARRGLVIPTDWFNHCNIIYGQELPWTLSAIMQNVMMSNPMAGERKTWKPK